MRTPVQERIARGPFGALLILLSLILSSGTAAAAGFDSRSSSARLGAGRPSAPTALLPSGIRNPLDEECSGNADGPSLAPSEPRPVALHLWERPAGPAFADEIFVGKRPSAPYRARAPPAA